MSLLVTSVSEFCQFNLIDACIGCTSKFSCGSQIKHMRLRRKELLLQLATEAILLFEDILNWEASGLRPI